jgi:phosphoserine aminotransferase
MADRVHNFYAGPATLPWDVVKKTAEGVLEFDDLGLSVMEISHRSKPFDRMFKRAQSNMLKVMGLSEDEYTVFFLGGGASTQFCMIPFNFLPEDGQADYVNTGRWSQKAIKEAKLFGKVNIAADSEPDDFTWVPREFKLNPAAAYVHTTSNNTVAGTQMFEFPETGDVPLVSDMSSDFLSRRLDFDKFDLVYAGAQKNIGPAGVTAVVIRRSWIDDAKEGVPTMLSYGTHLKKDSLFNTPPSLPVYVVGLVMEWILENGGLEGVEKRNDRKAAMVYDAIDGSDGFYRGVVRKDSRSKMNITFRLPSEELEAKFVDEGARRGLLGLKGHRSVGGCRASIYNAMTEDGVCDLVEFMKEFRRSN